MPKHTEIDAIVTWVDGSDPAFQRELNIHCRAAKKKTRHKIPAGASATRYKNNGEIELCLEGIRAMMPWVRKIFLVTNKQKPDFLTPQKQIELGLEIIDHEEIFRGFKWALPTFNSRTIETMTHRVPGIANRYIYLNDDFIPKCPASPEEFFVDEKVVVRAKWEKMSFLAAMPPAIISFALDALENIAPKERSGHLLAQMRAAKLAGFTKEYLHCSHAPHPVKTGTLRSYFTENQENLKKNIEHRLRSSEQFVTHPLAHHLEARKGLCITKEQDDSVTINFLKPEYREAIERAKSEDIKFVCLQNLEKADEATRETLLEYLKSRIREKKLGTDSDF